MASSQQSTNSKVMEQAKYVELVLFQAREGVDTDSARQAFLDLNQVVEGFDGFVARRTAIAEDGQYLDMIYWTELDLALKASEEAGKDKTAQKSFALMEEKGMIFKHFRIINTHGGE